MLVNLVDDATLLVRCKRRLCSVCGPSYWLPLTKAKLLSGLPQVDGIKAVGMTLTAPGGDLDVDSWNLQSGACWNRLRTAVRRVYPAAEFFRVIEFQKRGVIHLHVIVRGVSFIPHGLLKSLAVRAGFGPVVWLTRYHQRGAVAKYLAKYFLKDVDKTPGGLHVFSESRGWRLDWNRRSPERLAVEEMVREMRRQAGAGWIFAGTEARAFTLLNPRGPP